jgi:ELWxxDGT repeat protein
MINGRRLPMLVLGLAALIATVVLVISIRGGDDPPLEAPLAQAASKKPGAVLVKDISPGNPRRASSSGSPHELTDVAGTLYFVAQDRKHGFELWRSDGTRRGTRMVKDIRPGRTHTQLGLLTAVGKTLYFVADDGGHGGELWRSDGTARGTRMVKDINPGTGSTNVGSLTDVAGTLFFATHAGLWRSDGTEAGTTLVKQLQASTNGFTTVVGGVLYFSASDGIHGEQLWRSDGTSPGTVMVAPSGPKNPAWLTGAAGTLYFVAMGGTRYGLWRSDGTEAGTTLVKEAAGLTTFGWLTAAGGTLYFATIDYSANSPLWRSDGTEAGTTPITYLGVTPEGDGLYPQLTAVGGTLYFQRSGTLVRTDGTPGGTKVLGANLRPGSLTAAGHKLYFVSAAKRHGRELWRSNGTRKGTRLVRDIRRGGRSGRPRDLTAVGKTLFFSAHDFQHGSELWRAGPKP